MPCLTLSWGDKFEISLPPIVTVPDFKLIKPSIAFITVDFPAPLGPKMATISPLLTSTVQEVMMSGPPYPPVISFPSKNAINYFLLLLLNVCLNNFQ